MNLPNEAFILAAYGVSMSAICKLYYTEEDLFFDWLYQHRNSTYQRLVSKES